MAMSICFKSLYSTIKKTKETHVKYLPFKITGAQNCDLFKNGVTLPMWNFRDWSSISQSI